MVAIGGWDRDGSVDDLDRWLANVTGWRRMVGNDGGGHVLEMYRW